jgi:hypothetical protein
MERRGWTEEDIAERYKVRLLFPEGGYRGMPLTPEEQAERAVGKLVRDTAELTAAPITGQIETLAKLVCEMQIDAERQEAKIDTLRKEIIEMKVQNDLRSSTPTKLPNRVPHERLVALGLDIDHEVH